ncbi:MAG: hypothetical protein E7594_03125 [Ruminococcaceae bacterium]|nr:hypothetical protein [Oscillospiraceae bacterium]
MSKKELYGTFAAPGVEWRGKPFWSWNGELREEELVRQVEVMKEMGLGGYFMHSRAGLITEYLGDEWFDLINAVADAGEKMGMESWLYDEDRWPSGSAGGKVTVDEQYRKKSLFVFETEPEKLAWNDQSIALYVAKVDGINVYAYEEIDTAELACVNCMRRAVKSAIDRLAPTAEDKPGEWKTLRFAIVPDEPNSNYNGTTYIDTMSYKAVYKFIDMTHEEYKRRCGDRIGTSIKGIFTDEPHRGHCFDNYRNHDGVISCAMAWTDDIFDEFAKRYGYDARPILPELFYRYEGKQVSPVKLHYIDLANNLFIECFAMPINQWCKANGIEFTGHVLHEDSLMNQTVPNGSLMRFYEHMGYPGVDCLTEHNRCYWIVKQLSSAARQLDKKWLLSELYGCTGWQFDFKAHKAVGDWQALFGINLRCQHLSWYTMEGESKRDYPASILHQSPWYKDYATVEDHFARMGVILAAGKPDCDVLVLNPIESLWCQAYLGWAQWISNVSPDVAPYEQRYAQLFHMLTDNQIDFDYGEEQIMRDKWSLDADADGKAVLRIGSATYKTVLVTNMLTIRPTTLEILQAFKDAGGEVIFAGDVPAYVDAVASDAPAALAACCKQVGFDESEIVEAIRATSECYASVTDADGKTEKAVFVQVRCDVDGEGGMAAVLLNTDRQNARKDLVLRVAVPAGMSVEEWDLESGKRYNTKVNWKDGIAEIGFDLDAAGTRCFVLTAQREQLPVQSAYAVKQALEITEAEFAPILDEQNVCVLDYCRWRWADGEWSESAEALRIDQKVRDAVGIERRGGEMLQPWFAKLHHKQKYGEIELEYEFYIDQMPAGQVVLAGERPETNAYSINGVALENKDINDFWVDDCFKKMYIPEGALKLGRNVVTIKVNFMRTTNIEAIYLVGDFGVALSETNTRTLVASPERVGLGNYANYALPFYTGSMTYRILPEMYAGLEIGEGDRVMISAKFTGGCFKVITEDGAVQVCGWDPWQIDVTEAVKAGQSIDLCVVGTRKNVFGPLHQLPAIAGACGPGNFVTGGPAWTDEYVLIDSGAQRIQFTVETVI